MRFPARPIHLLALLAPVIAAANGVGLPDTKNVLLRPGSAEVAIDTTWGLVSAPDIGSPFGWTCYEVVLNSTSTIATVTWYPGENVTMATSRSIGQAIHPNFSLYRSTDGCNWDSPADLEGINIRDLSFDPSDPDRALATGFNGGTGVLNGIWITGDSGATWALSNYNRTERFIRTVMFAPGDASRVYATATWYLPNAQAWVLVSDNGGVDWTETPWTFTVDSVLQGTIDIVAVSPSDADIAYIRSNGAPDYLLRTTNGGAGWAVVHESVPEESDLRGVHFGAGGAVWFSTIDGPWRSTDGVTFTQTAPDISTRGVGSDARGLFAVANNWEDGFALGLDTSGAGTGFRKIFQYHELSGPKTCPAGSDVAIKCEPQWPVAAYWFGVPTPTPSGDDDDDDGGGREPGACSCSLGRGAPTLAPFALAFLTLAVAYLRRRR